MSIVGRAILLLAFAVAVYAVVSALASRSPKRRGLRESSERAIYAFFALVTMASATLLVALATGQWDLRLVTEYTSETLPLHYKLTSMWASQEGSLLLWVWVLSGYAALVVYLNRRKNREIMPYVIAVLGGIGIFFTFLLSFVTSPFETLAMVPDEGRGLNPLLQNPYMVSHPPLLYLGYVGLAVPFAFAIGALASGKLDSSWIAATRRYTIVAWLFLAMGIILGSRWAYEELGWGGYWAWDPVENAAFMPWLVATAFLHSVMVQERRGMLRVWNMALIILTFTMAIFGTFLTRSGIIASVHAFGESTLGTWFLGFIAVIVIGSTALLVMRIPMLRSRHSLESYISREAIFLFNNLLLVGLAFAVFWGTVFPIISEAVRGQEITVGQGYYDQIAVPIGIALLILTGVGPLVPWRKASLRRLASRFVAPVGVGIAAALALLVLTDAWSNPAAAGTIAAAAFVVACISGEVWRAARTRHALGDVSWAGAVTQPIMRNRRRHGGYLVHIGVAVLFVGLAASSAYVSQADFALRAGERGEVGGYTFVYENAQRARDEHVGSVGVALGVFKDGDRVTTMEPAVNFYFAQEQRSTEVAIDSSASRDVYVVLAGLDESGLARFSVFVNPLVTWLWAAGLIIFVGGVFAAWPPAAGRRAVAASEDASVRAGARSG